MAAALAAATILAGAGAARAATPTPPKTADNHILVGGAVGFAFTRKTAQCSLKGGKPVGFQTPDISVEPAPPDATAWLEGGAWMVEVHTPGTPRDFEKDDAGGIVVKSMPGGNWQAELHSIRMNEREAMSLNYASVSGIITCTSYIDLDALKKPPK